MTERPKHVYLIGCRRKDYGQSIRLLAATVDGWLDPHSLAMALQLAKELDAELATPLGSGAAYDFIEIADWLRAEVEKELDAQS